VLEEIGNASEDEKRILFNLIEQYQPKNIPIIREMLNLSRKYLSEKALPKKADCFARIFGQDDTEIRSQT
jgi:hypothetical protein